MIAEDMKQRGLLTKVYGEFSLQHNQTFFPYICYMVHPQVCACLLHSPPVQDVAVCRKLAVTSCDEELSCDWGWWWAGGKHHLSEQFNVRKF